MTRQSIATDWIANQQDNDPASGVRFYGDLAAGRAQMHTRRPSHRASIVQSHFGRHRAIMATADGDSTTISSFGATFSSQGVVTAAATDPSTFLGGQRRAEIKLTTPSTSNAAGLYSTVAQFQRGDAAGKGGWYMAFRWAVGTGQAATTRAFCGLSSSVASISDVDPSSLADCIGMGWDAADNEIQIMHRTGTGTVQKYALYDGIWPVPTSDNGALFLFELYCPPNGSGISWRLEEPVSQAFDFGTFFTDIPANTTMLAPRIYQSVGGVSSVIGINFMNLYAETDF